MWILSVPLALNQEQRRISGSLSHDAITLLRVIPTMALKHEPSPYNNAHVSLLL